MEEENKICEICNKRSRFVRFEGSEEKNICDNCLYELKEKKYNGSKR